MSLNQLHQMMTAGRTQAEPVSAEPFTYAGKEYEGFISPATSADATMVDGYIETADFLIVVDKSKFANGTEPEKKRGEILARGKSMRIMSRLDDASSYTIYLKLNQ